jgi:spermidine synthase
MGFAGLLVCLFVSGASGLIYEVAWVRSLELVFGATSFAVATVLAAFMGGLALGSFLMGRRAARLERFHPLHVYAAIELLIGAAGLIVPFALRALVPLYQSIWSQFHSSFAVFSLWRFLLCGAVLLVPTALMGATLPIASRLAPGGAPRADSDGSGVGLLYACNTLGAVVGCAAAGLSLLPAIGLRRTEWLAVGLNLLAAAGAFVAAGRWTVLQQGPGQPGERHEGATDTTTGRTATVLIILYAVSGGVAMVYEVAWTRLLVLVLGSSTYSYTIMLTTFLAGLTLGAWLGARLLKDWPDPLLTAALCQVLVGLSTYLGLFLMRDLPFLYVMAHNRLEPSPRGLILVQLALASGLMILPTMGLGAMFPVTIGGLRPGGERTPRIVGRAYSWNTLGAITGSVMAGFWLVPRWGSRTALLFGVATSLLLGLVGLTLARVASVRRLRLLLLLAIVAFLANLTAAAPVLSEEVLSSGVFRYADRYRGVDHATFLERVKQSHGEILMFREGLTCTVTVFRTTAARTLLVNGKPDASVSPGLPEPSVGHTRARWGDLPTQVLLAQLPMLLAPRTDRVLVVGLGSGVTLGSVLTHPVRQVECVELEDAVVQASHFFDDVSGSPLRDPRVRLVVNDARNHLLVTRERYDVIVSEPSNPWVAGAAGLFTRDFFDLAARRLAPDGVFCQWLQRYETTADDFSAILRSFAAVFSDVHVFRVDTDTILVGSKGRAGVRLEALLDRPGVGPARDLERIGIGTPRDLLAHYWIGGAELRSFLAPGPLNTDDNMLIEFAAPLRMLSRRPEALEAQDKELEGLFAGRTTGVLTRLDQKAADPHAQARFWGGLAGSTLAGGYPDLAFVYASRSLRAARNPEAARVYGACLALSGHRGPARQWLLAAALEFPRDPALLRSLVEMERDEQDWSAIRGDARRLLSLAPEDRRARFWEGESLYHLGDRQAAYRALAPLWPADPAVGAVQSALARGTAAQAPAPAAGERFPELGLYLGTLHGAAGHPADALAPLREYLGGHPADREARTLLAGALEAAGRTREATAERRRLSPDAGQQAGVRLEEAEAAWDSGPRETIRARLEEAREYDPDSDAIAFLLARSRVRAGDLRGAILLLEEFLDAHPDHPWAVGYLGQLDAADGNAARAGILAQRHLALTGRSWEAVNDP